MNADHARRKAREVALAVMYRQMQRDIDAARGEIWTRHFMELVRINPKGLTQDFCAKFDKAWKRSLQPNVARADMTPDGNYLQARPGAA